MQTAIIIAVVTAGNALCFLLGSRRRSPPGSMPQQNADPRRNNLFSFARKKETKTTDPMDVIMANLENYDGTSFGQKDIPKG